MNDVFEPLFGVLSLGFAQSLVDLIIKPYITDLQFDLVLSRLSLS